ncbi:MAG: ATP-binding protein [Bacteroidota bacterium]
MPSFDEISSISPLPIVNLNNIGKPNGGLSVQLSKSCLKYFHKENECIKHYENLKKNNLESPTPVQCPFGFASIVFKVCNEKVALTGFVPYPRLGGKDEPKLAKQHPECKISIDKLTKTISFIKDVSHRIESIETAVIKNQSMALHEIRKLNRTIKQTAERLTQKNSSPELLQIQKTSELMSNQFDIIEILANETLTQIERKSNIEVYRIFDKCVHIYQTPDQRIKLHSQSGFFPKITANDKTFPIIPTVLIENALKYSAPKQPIKISIDRDDNKCMVSVSNLAELEKNLDDSIFSKGVRNSTDTDGSGYGLYVAQLVANQHNTLIQVKCIPANDKLTKVTFTVSFEYF